MSGDEVIREWNCQDFKCILMVHETPSMRWYTGYVGVSSPHPFYGKGYDDVELEVEIHGGLTYAGEGMESWKEMGDLWFLGFDTAHAQDDVYSEAYLAEHPDFPVFKGYKGHRWTPDEVAEETEKLAKELKRKVEE